MINWGFLVLLGIVFWNVVVFDGSWLMSDVLVKGVF